MGEDSELFHGAPCRLQSLQYTATKVKVSNLKEYFETLIKKVEASQISNQGKDKDGFFKPTRELILRHLNLLRDLHAKPLAKAMVKDSWKFVVEHVPPEMLVMNEEQKKALKNLIS